MFEDTTKRLQTLLDQMDSNSVKERVVGPLGDMIQGKRTGERTNGTNVQDVIAMSCLIMLILLCFCFSSINTILHRVPSDSRQVDADGL